MGEDVEGIWSDIVSWSHQLHPLLITTHLSASEDVNEVRPLVPFRSNRSITARRLLDGAVILPRSGNEVLVRDMGRLAGLSEVRLPRQQVLVLGRFFVENVHRLDTVLVTRLTGSFDALAHL